MGETEVGRAEAASRGPFPTHTEPRGTGWPDTAILEWAQLAPGPTPSLLPSPLSFTALGLIKVIHF